MSEAALDSGQPYSKTEYTYNGDGTFKSCDSEDPTPTECLAFGGFKLDPAGKLVDLTFNQQQIGPRMTVGNGQTVTAAGTKFTFLTAYKSIQSNALYVTVRIETGTKAISTSLSQAIYRSPDGKQRTATDSSGVYLVGENSNTIVSMSFASVKAGGTVTLDGCVPQDCTSQYSAVLKVG